MTLAGFLPPIPDVDEDHSLLVDGGCVLLSVSFSYRYGYSLVFILSFSII